jgi:hypothetical protein
MAPRYWQGFLFLFSEFEPQRAYLSPPRCFTCLLGLQGIQWIQRLVVVRLNWLGRPSLKKKYNDIIMFIYNILEIY